MEQKLVIEEESLEGVIKTVNDLIAQVSDKIRQSGKRIDRKSTTQLQHAAR